MGTVSLWISVPTFIKQTPNVKLTRLVELVLINSPQKRLFRKQKEICVKIKGILAIIFPFALSSSAIVKLPAIIIRVVNMCVQGNLVFP